MKLMLDVYGGLGLHNERDEGDEEEEGSVVVWYIVSILLRQSYVRAEGDSTAVS